jgi:Retroviral aspartyl protease
MPLPNRGCLNGVDVLVDSVCFSVDFIVTDLARYDVILGMPWF